MKFDCDENKKVSIYLAENISTKEDILGLLIDKYRNIYDLKQKDNTKVFYILDSSKQGINWSNFFNLTTSDSPEIKNLDKPFGIIFYLTLDNYCFTVPFGCGGGRLDKSKFIYNFGLKTALNMIGNESIMHQTSKSFSESKVRKDVASTNSRSLSELGFDKLTDILSNIDGNPKEIYAELFPCKVSGSQALNVSLSPKKFKEQLNTLENIYKKDDYKVNFEFIDNLSPLLKGETELKTELDLKILEMLFKNEFAVFAPLPSNFYYSIIDCTFKENSVLLTNAGFLNIVNISKKSPKSLVNFLKVNKVSVKYGVDSFENTEEISLYKFLSLDLEYANQHYLLENGMWFRINRDLIKMVDEYLSERIIDKPVDFVDVPLDSKSRKGKVWHSLQNEEDYLLNISKNNDEYILGDQKLVKGTEVFDLLRKDTLFHIKKGTSGSSPLSHLFKQGVVSVTRLKSEFDFFDQVKKKINGVDLDLDKAVVAFGIIKNANKLPVFSKISFRMDSMKIESMLREKVQVFFIKHEEE